MIPEAAVEAATKAFRETHFMDDALMNALEAIAPLLMARAWEEGYRDCYERQMYEPVPTNPHKQAAK